jgi:HlyD family secretion protein
MKWNMKAFALTALALFAALVLWMLLRPERVSVETARAERRAMTVTIEEQGRTRARDPFIIAAPITGRLLRPVFEAGDQVEAGSILARISVPPDDRRSEAMAEASVVAAQARRAAAEGAVLEAESSHARARNEEERRAELAKTGATAAEELDYYQQAADAAEARLLSLRAALQAAEAEVESARSRLLGSTPDAEEGILSVSAPVNGTIYRVFEESERVVAAGTPLYALSRDNELEIVVDLVTQEAVRVQAGQPLLLSGWGGSDILFGNVTRVEPEAFTKLSALGVEEQRVNVIGRLQSIPAGLGAEYRVDAAIVVWEADDVLTVPASAVFRRGGTWQLFTVDAGRARLRTLDVGQRNRDHVQVLGGIDAGAEVIVFPSDLVVDGVPVTADAR